MQVDEQSAPAFALAKIQPPRPRVELIDRPALDHALDASVRRCRLTLLVAPAGYGKTVALTRLIRRGGHALAWISADEDDRLQRFLACLIAALEPYDLPWRVDPSALATMGMGARSLRDIAAELANTLGAADVAHGLIVIDDAHRIGDAQIFALLQLLLDGLPPQWALVLASRSDPPLALARLRAAGEVAELRQQDLRFDEAEVAALLGAGAAEADAPSARELLRRTGGWAAGLRLSLNARRPGPARRGGGDAGQRHLFDYLASEVLDGMPAELREFLLRCSVLSELSAERCADVAGVADPVSLLEAVERRGLFVSVLDADELTLRLHDLFREFLEDRLRRERPGELPQLLRRAALHEDDLVRAVGYLCRAGDFEGAAMRLMARGAQRIAAGDTEAVRQSLAMLPAACFETHPGLHMLHGTAAFMAFDFDTVVSAMQRAAAGFEREGRAREAALAHAHACLAMASAGRRAQADVELAQLRTQVADDEVRALVYFASAWSGYASTQVEQVAPHFERMLDALDRAPPQAWAICFFHTLLVGLPGMRPLLERFSVGALRISGDTPSALRAGVLHSRAWMALSDGRLDEAFDWLARADADCRWLGMVTSIGTENWMTHALFDALRGRREASEAASHAVEEDMRREDKRGDRRAHEYEVRFNHARAAWLLGDADGLREVEAAMQRCANPDEWSAAPLNRRFCAALVAMAETRLDDAAVLLEPLAERVNRSCFFSAQQAAVLLADVQWRRREPEAAAAALRVALDGAELGGAVLAGAPVLRRLAEARWGMRVPPALPQQLAALAAQIERLAGGPGATAPAQAPGAASAGLSEREREVLARIALGDSNKLIARAFDLSPHTVKRHVANILGKLGVDTRGQAAARFRAGL